MQQNIKSSLYRGNEYRIYKRFGFQILIFAILFIITIFNYRFYLTNEFTPGGDGRRIYTYLKYMEKVPELFPFWQAHKHHGYPLIANPENHMPLALFLNTESPSFNFHLNLLFFILTAIFAFSCRCISRLLGLTQIASFVVGATTIVCVPMARVFMHGSISALIYYVFVYMAILIWMVSLNSGSAYSVFLLLLSSAAVAWVIQSGYYLPIIFHIPAASLLICAYLRKGVGLSSSLKKTSIVITFITILAILLSAPFLFSIIDGVLSSKLFENQIDTITIEYVDIYNYYFGLWPFIVLAVFYSKGILRQYAVMMAAMASINLILMFLSWIEFKSFFDLWISTPVLKNIRWQHPFREISSIAAAFSVGIFIDTCRERYRLIKIYQTVFVLSSLLIFIGVAYVQYQSRQTIWMVLITILFMMLVVIKKNSSIVIAMSCAILLSLFINFGTSPISGEFYTSKNNQKFRKYTGNYIWTPNSYSKDKFTPYFRYGKFSMIFMSEYRMLLSLLYGTDINAQRPHWIPRMDSVNENNKNPQLVRLLGMTDPGSNDWESPFRVYDRWVVGDDTDTIRKMKAIGFNLDKPILLNQAPTLHPEKKYKLESSAELTGKTADSITLKVKTNKNSVVLVPEIYHRNWYARLDEIETPVLKAFASLRAVSVPPGEHTIEMKFIYWPFRLGLYIAIASLFVSILIVFRFREPLFYWLVSCDKNQMDQEKRYHGTKKPSIQNVSCSGS